MDIKDIRTDQPNSKKMIVGFLLVILALVVVGFFVLRGTDNVSKTSVNKGANTVPADSNSPINGSTGSTTPSVQLINATTFKDLSGGQITGDANRMLKDNGVVLAARVKKLSDLSDSSVYAVFLSDMVNSSNPPVFVGSLTKAESGEYKGEFLLGSQGPKEWMNYKKIVVSTSANSGPIPTMGKVILEGSFVK